VLSYGRMTNGDELRQRVTQLRREGESAAQIAATLNQEGFSPPRRCNPFSKEQVWQLLARYGLTTKLDVVQLGPYEWRLSALAKSLGVPNLRLRNWAQKGWVHARQTPTQALWIVWADPDDLQRLRSLTARSKWGVQSHPLELTTPKRG
jgi:hypothetical protein